jgi:hypothetical protein
MATSGTASFNLDILEVIDEAYERCGVEGARTGYDLKTARRSMGLLFADFSNRGLNMWTIDQGTLFLVPGVETYDLPTDTVDLIEHVIRTSSGSTSSQADLAISRISVSTYATMPNKLNQGRPIQLYVDRQITPKVTVWPVPDDSQQYLLVYWRLRRIQDAGDGTNTMDIPFRFLPCMVAGLAYYLALKTPGAMDRIGLLKQQFDEAFEMAASEDRDKSPIRLVPRQSFV